jgi:hypothetical protein
MTRCRELEALLGGDAAGLAGHLSACPVCRDGLRGLAAEVASAGVYAAVRQSVESRIRRRRLAWLAVPVAAAAALMVALLLQLPPDPAPPELALHAPPAPAVSAAPPAPEPARPKPAGEPPFATVARADSNGILLRLRFDDPNVVIYWMIDENGGSE